MIRFELGSDNLARRMRGYFHPTPSGSSHPLEGVFWGYRCATEIAGIFSVISIPFRGSNTINKVRFLSDNLLRYSLAYA
jgi:hypothetical protein